MQTCGECVSFALDKNADLDPRKLLKLGQFMEILGEPDRARNGGSIPFVYGHCRAQTPNGQLNNGTFATAPCFATYNGKLLFEARI